MTFMTLIIFFLILTFVMAVHELGHFIAAKRAGIVVTEFGLGYPPRIWKFWQGKGSITLDDQEFSISRKTDLPRDIRVGSEVIVETTPRPDGKAEITHLVLVPPEERKDTDKSDPARAPDQPVFTVEAVTRPTEYTLNWIPIFNFVRMQGEDYPSGPGSLASKSKWTRLAVVMAGPVTNLITAVFLFTLTSMSGVPEPVTGINLAGEEAPVAQTVITEVVPNTPAEAAGLQIGDIILGANDVKFNYIGDLFTFVGNTKGTEITLHLERDGRPVSTSLVSRVHPLEGQEPISVGITFEGLQNEIIYYPLHQALVRGVAQTGQYVGLVFYMPIASLRRIISAEAVQPNRASWNLSANHFCCRGRVIT